MEKAKTNIHIKLGILFLGILSFASLLIARANHYTAEGDAEIFEQLNQDFACEETKLKPVKLNSKGEKVKNLQNCLAFLGAEIEVNSVYDSQTQEALKWMFEHIFNKKINGKKMNKKAANELKQLVQGVKEYLANPPQKTVQYSNEEESVDAKAEVEKALKEDLPRMRAEIRRLAKDELNIELPEKVPEKSEYEGIEGTYHSIVKFSDRVEKHYKDRNYDRALLVFNNIKRDYDQLLVDIPNIKERYAQDAAARAEQRAQEEANAASEKKYEEEMQANRKKLATAKTAQAKQKKEALSCINRYLKFSAPSKYAMSIYQHEGALCPNIYFIPQTTHSYWDEELGKTIYVGGPQITIVLSTPQAQYKTESFVAEKMKEGASIKTIKGDTWYYRKLSEGKDSLTMGSYEAFTENTQIRFTVYLDITVPGEDPKTLQKIKSDFEKMVQTIAINHNLPSKIEPVGLPTKESLLLQGTWKLIETFSQGESIGYPPLVTRLIAFQLSKICSAIQEENTNRCYTGYVPYKLAENVLIFKESGKEKRWEILKNTASELEILDEKGTTYVFQKTSGETTPDR